jgi:hypothetical protein
MQARTSQINKIQFRSYLAAYRPLTSVANVRIFARQARAFRRFIRGQSSASTPTDTRITMALAQCMAIIAYAQLVAENSAQCKVPPEIISAIFHLLISDFSNAALALAAAIPISGPRQILLGRAIAVPATTNADWDFVLQRAKLLAAE